MLTELKHQHQQHQLPVILRTSPFRLETKQYNAVPGQSIADILAAVPDLPLEIWTHGVVFIGEVEIPRDKWHRVKPKPGTRNLIKVGVQLQGGGGGGKSIFTTIAAIALIVVTTAITGGILGPAGALSISSTLFAAGSTSAALLAAGVSVVGALALSALAPAPTAAKGASEEASKGNQLGSAAIQGNTLGPYDGIPFVAGRHRVTPPHLIPPWSESFNDDQYVYAIIGLNGAHDIEDIRINETPIDDFDDIEYEVRDVINDDTDLTIIDKQVFENQVGADLIGHKLNDDATDELQDTVTPANSYPKWLTARSRTEPDQIWLSFVWTGLVFQQSDGNTTEAGVGVRIRIRRIGDVAWVNLPEFHAQRERLEPFRATLKINFVDAPSSITRPDQSPSFPPWAYAFYAQNSDNAEAFNTDSYFAPSSGKLADEVGIDENGIVTIYLDPTVFPKGTYDVQVMRGYGYQASLLNVTNYQYNSNIPYFFSHTAASSPPAIRVEQSKAPSKTSWASISSVWNDYPIGERGLTLLAVKAKNVSVNQLSVIATGYANVWDGETWDKFEPTSNCAAWLRYIALGGQSIRAPFIEAQLDNDNLVDFYDWSGDERTLGQEFDGALFYERAGGLTGAADSKLWSMSAWVYITSGTGGRIVTGVTALNGGTGSTRFVLGGGNNKISLVGVNSAGVTILDIQSSSLLPGRWYHVLASVDMADTAKRHIYIDDVSDLDVITTYTNDTIDFTLADWGVGAYPNGTSILNGMLGEVWFAPGVYIDFSVEENRRKFISTHRRPVDLGPTGNKPTGTAPLLYLSAHVEDTELFSDNRGTGGTLTVTASGPGTSPIKDGANSMHREFNAYIDGSRSVGEVMRLIAGCGKAAVRLSDKIGVTIDNDRSDQSPIQLFTQRNTRGLTIRRAFPKLPQSLRIRFNDEDNDYLPAEFFVNRQAIPFPTDTEAAEYIGITKKSRAIDRANHDLTQLTRRQSLYNYDADIENLYCTKGSLVALAHDTIRRHYDAARVKSIATSGGDVTGLVLDATLRLHLLSGAEGAQFNNDYSTRLLVHFDGTDGSTTFTDSSSFGRTLTTVANAQLTTDTKVFGTASGLFDGSGDEVTAADSNDFNLTTQEFKIDCRFKCTAPLGAFRNLCGQRASTSAADTSFMIYRLTTGEMEAHVCVGTSFFTVTSTTQFSDVDNTGWHHLSFIRTSVDNTLKLAIDGVVEDEIAITGSVNSVAATLTIGGQNWLGNVDELRMVIGREINADDFTVPSQVYVNPPAAAYATRGADLTGTADSKLLAGSFWVYIVEGPSEEILTSATAINGGTLRTRIRLTSGNAIQIIGAEVGTGNRVLDVAGSTSLQPGRWYHVLFSFDMANAANRHMYIDDAAETINVTTYTDAAIDFTHADWAIGGGPNGSSRFNGSLAEFWYAPGQYIDFSVEANRREFISAQGRPINLGTTGNIPTGVAPLIYFSGNDGNFIDNEGTGGAFTMVGETEESLLYDGYNLPAGVVIQFKDGTTATYQIDESDDTDTITFTTPFTIPADDILDDHCLVAAGPFASNMKRMLVLGVQPQDDHCATMTLVDEAEKVAIAFEGDDQVFFEDNTRAYAPY